MISIFLLFTCRDGTAFTGIRRVHPDTVRLLICVFILSICIYFPYYGFVQRWELNHASREAQRKGITDYLRLSKTRLGAPPVLPVLVPVRSSDFAKLCFSLLLFSVNTNTLIFMVHRWFLHITEGIVSRLLTNRIN